jgi:hypothetical protein
MRSVMTAIVVSLSLLACGKEAPPAPPPPEVSVVTVAPRSVDETLELALRQVQRQYLVATVQLYRALGGSWAEAGANSDGG